MTTIFRHADLSVFGQGKLHVNFTDNLKKTLRNLCNSIMISILFPKTTGDYLPANVSFILR